MAGLSGHAADCDGQGPRARAGITLLPGPGQPLSSLRLVTVTLSGALADWPSLTKLDSELPGDRTVPGLTKR